MSSIHIPRPSWTTDSTITTTNAYYWTTIPTTTAGNTTIPNWIKQPMQEISICLNLNPIIKDIKILKKDMVVGFTFSDGTKIKTICSEGDIFSLEYACYLAYAKKLFGKTLTFEGVLTKATELSYQKSYVKLVHEAIKNYNKKLKEEEKKKKEEQEKKEIKKRQQIKKAEKKKKQNEKYVKEIVSIIEQVR